MRRMANHHQTDEAYEARCRKVDSLHLARRQQDVARLRILPHLPFHSAALHIERNIDEVIQGVGGMHEGGRKFTLTYGDKVAHRP